MCILGVDPETESMYKVLIIMKPSSGQFCSLENDVYRNYKT